MSERLQDWIRKILPGGAKILNTPLSPYTEDVLKNKKVGPMVTVLPPADDSETARIAASQANLKLRSVAPGIFYTDPDVASSTGENVGKTIADPRSDSIK